MTNDEILQISQKYVGNPQISAWMSGSGLPNPKDPKEWSIVALCGILDEATLEKALSLDPLGLLMYGDMADGVLTPGDIVLLKNGFTVDDLIVGIYVSSDPTNTLVKVRAGDVFLEFNEKDFFRRDVLGFRRAKEKG